MRVALGDMKRTMDGRVRAFDEFSEGRDLLSERLRHRVDIHIVVIEVHIFLLQQ